MQLFPDLGTPRTRRLLRQAGPPWAAPTLRDWVWPVACAGRLAMLITGVAIAALVLDVVGERVARAALGALGQSASAELRLPAPEQFGALAERSLIVNGDGATLATLYGEENRRLVPLDALPEHVWQAVLAAEDRRFFEHEGYDPRAVSRAVRENVIAGDIVQGGSTITQQLAKSFVGDDVSFERKREELLQAMALERHYTKEELLERYVNEIYFGSGTYGIDAAAEEFFGVRAADLRVEQAALLGGLIRSPERLNPRRNPDGALARRDAILAGMAEEGFIGPEEASQLQALPLGTLPARDDVVSHPYVVEAVKREFLANPAFGETRAERIDMLFSGGIVVETTFDLALQRRAEQLIRQWLPQANITAAVAIVDPQSGRVHAAASGRDFGDDQYDLALQGRRQPGSAFKTFVLTAALEQGLPLSTELEGESGATFGTERTTGDWATRGVRNFGGASYEDLDARAALVRSVNSAFADLVLQIGPQAALSVTDRLGISRAAYGGHENPAIALGGLDRGVTTLEMASAYGVFATGGGYVRPFVIERVTDLDGEVLYEAAPERERVLDQDVNAVVRSVLEQVVSSGTGGQARIAGWPVAGKTGTSQDLSDVWFAGATPARAAAVWVGNPTSRQRLHGMSSSGTAAPLWGALMELAHAGLEPRSFPDAGRALPQTLVGDDDEDDEDGEDGEGDEGDG